MFATLDRGIESACKARVYRSQVAKHAQLDRLAYNLADQASQHTVGSPEWRRLAAEFGRVCQTAEDNGTPIIK